MWLFFEREACILICVSSNGFVRKNISLDISSNRFLSEVPPKDTRKGPSMSLGCIYKQIKESGVCELAHDWKLFFISFRPCLKTHNLHTTLFYRLPNQNGLWRKKEQKGRLLRIWWGFLRKVQCTDVDASSATYLARQSCGNTGALTVLSSYRSRLEASYILRTARRAI